MNSVTYYDRACGETGYATGELALYRISIYWGVGIGRSTYAYICAVHFPLICRRNACVGGIGRESYRHPIAKHIS